MRISPRKTEGKHRWELGWGLENKFTKSNIQLRSPERKEHGKRKKNSRKLPRITKRQFDHKDPPSTAEGNRPRAGRNFRAQRPKRGARFPKGGHAICKASRIRCRAVTATPEATAQSSITSGSPETMTSNPAGRPSSLRQVLRKLSFQTAFLRKLLEGERHQEVANQER